MRVVDNAATADAESAVIMGAARLGSTGSFQVQQGDDRAVMSVENESRDDNTFFIIGLVVIVVVVIVVIAAVIYNREKVGKSSDPSAQQAALTLLDSIPVHWAASKSGYSREQFGKPWTDDVDDVEFGHNHCDTRDDILRRDLSNVVPPKGCAVTSGVLHDPYTGRDIPFNRDEGTDVLVQIDHVVALLDAWQTGAQQWNQVKRTQLANDPLDLLAVDGKANRKKKASNVASWLPSNKDFRCEYVTRVVQVKAKYGLWMVQAEREEASRVLKTCSSQVLSSSGAPPSSGMSPSSGVLPSVGIRFPSSSAVKRPN